MVTSRYSTRGFTLVETMVVVAVLGVIAMVAPAFMHQMSNFYQQESTKLTLQRDGRTVTDLIERFAREAKASSIIIDQASGSQPPFSRLTFTTMEGTVMQFYQQGNQLIQIAQPPNGATANSSVLTNNLYTLSFNVPRSDDPTLVSLAVTLQSAVSGNQSQLFDLSIRKIHLMNS